MTLAGEQSRCRRTARSTARRGSASDVQIGAGVRLMGPVVLGDGARVGDGAQLRESIVFPGTDVAPGAIMIGAIAGHAGDRSQEPAPALSVTSS